MNQTMTLGPNYDRHMLQALFDALTLEGAQTIDQKVDTRGEPESGYWKFQLDGGTLEVSANLYLKLDLIGSAELIRKYTLIIQDKILSAFPRND